jgi:hypothetical protein
MYFLRDNNIAVNRTFLSASQLKVSILDRFPKSGFDIKYHFFHTSYVKGNKAFFVTYLCDIATDSISYTNNLSKVLD